MASDLTRAAQTAGIIAGRLGLPLEFDPHLREQALGTLEGEQMSGPAGADGGVPDDVLDILWDHPFDQPPGGESVAAMYERVNRALAALPDRQRAAVVLFHQEGLSLRQAAEVLTMSESAFASLLARARAALKTALTAADAL